MNSLLCSLWEDFINSIREINHGTKVLVVVVMVALMVTCIAFAINKGKKHDEKPIKWWLMAIAGVLLFLIISLSVIT